MDEKSVEEIILIAKGLLDEKEARVRSAGKSILTLAESGKKHTLDMRVSVHPIQAKLWENRARIDPGMSLREIGELIYIDSPQRIKHHLQAMVKLGAIDFVGGQYLFPPMYQTKED